VVIAFIHHRQGARRERGLQTFADLVRYGHFFLSPPSILRPRP
jgi:hypothetical protein